MREEKKLLRLSLQFFGEDDEDVLEDVDTDDPDDADGEFDEEFFDEDDIDLYGDNGLDDNADDGTDDADNADDADDNADDGAEDNAEDADDGAENAENGAENVAEGGTDNNAQDSNGDLISELRALGYVGNDLASLTADMKAKREAREAQDTKTQRAADKADGKSHIRSGKPGKTASGDGTGGVNERRVISVAENAKISREEARRMLAKHARLIEGK